MTLLRITTTLKCGLSCDENMFILSRTEMVRLAQLLTSTGTVDKSFRLMNIQRCHQAATSPPQEVS
ncbi:hypothetical protein BDR04DRAFT_1102813 [Suillus decipiens]|nr:hypothetical protein BDR04DRAFT_1102813 [Suillus decipiens]